MVRKVDLSARELKLLKAKYAHHSGIGVKIYDINSRKHIREKNPIFLKHGNGLMMAGFHPKTGKRVSQFVKTT